MATNDGITNDGISPIAPLLFIPLRAMSASYTSNTLSSYHATYKAAAPMPRS
jgi:hypothetical protein